jgi:hypothetical protein
MLGKDAVHTGEIERDAAEGRVEWPSSEVPAPKGLTGTRASPQSFTTSTTSSVVSANSTGSHLIQVKV